VLARIEHDCKLDYVRFPDGLVNGQCFGICAETGRALLSLFEVPLRDNDMLAAPGEIGSQPKADVSEAYDRCFHGLLPCFVASIWGALPRRQKPALFAVFHR